MLIMLMMVIVEAESRVGGRHSTQLKSAPAGCQDPRMPWVAPSAGPEQGLMGAALLCAQRWMPLFLCEHSLNLRHRYVWEVSQCNCLNCHIVVRLLIKQNHM